MNKETRKNFLIDYLNAKNGYSEMIASVENELAESWKESADKAKFDKLNLPNEITVFHGAVFGFGCPWWKSHSWTLSKDTAKWFAEKAVYETGKSSPVIASTVITKDQIIAYMDELGENEVLIKLPLVNDWKIEKFEEANTNE